jgi:cytochrome b561
LTALLQRWSPWIVVAGTIAFVLLDSLATSLADPAYDWHNDYVSSLSGRGSSVWQIADAGLLAFALAHLAAAEVVRTQWRARWVARLLQGSGIAFLGAAVFRTACPLGEARCGIEGAHNQLDDSLSALHGGLVSIYLVLMLMAMLVAGFSSGRRTGPARWLLLASFPLAGLAWYSLGRFGAGPDFGLWERCWLICNAVWLALLTAGRRVEGHAPVTPVFPHTPVR